MPKSGELNSQFQLINDDIATIEDKIKLFRFEFNSETYNLAQSS